MLNFNYQCVDLGSKLPYPSLPFLFFLSALFSFLSFQIFFPYLRLVSLLAKV